MSNMDSLRLFVANTGSWIATGITFAAVESAMRLAALAASLLVSLVSVWWIVKQARAHDKKGH